MSPLFFVGPFVAVIGIVAVFFVMRHKSVQTRSMYSSRRSNLERKVRAARTRTLGPEKHEKEAASAAGKGAAGGPAKVASEPAAFAGPPVAPPSAPMAAPNQSWDVGPTAPAPPSPPAAAPPPPPPPAFEPQPPPPPEATWTPTPLAPSGAPQAAAPEPVPEPVPAGAGASWSIVGGEVKDTGISEPDGKKKKKGRGDPQADAWQLASGEAPSDDAEDEARRPGAALAIAQYAVLVVGLVMVLIGVLVMVANSHVT